MTQTLRNETLGIGKRLVEIVPTEEVSVRIEAAGYGGVPLRAIVPVNALSGIERGDLPVETNLKLRVPGYGWRAVEARVFTADEEDVSNETRPLRLTVSGYGRTPLRMAFLG